MDILKEMLVQHSSQELMKAADNEVQDHVVDKQTWNGWNLAQLYLNERILEATNLSHCSPKPNPARKLLLHKHMDGAAPVHD